MAKLRVTKIYFPMVTVVRIDDGVQPRYYTSTRPGEIYSAPEVIETEAEWQEALAEAETKGARVEVEEFLPQERKLPSRPFPKTYGDWVNLAEDIKEAQPDVSYEVNTRLGHIASDSPEADDAKRWLVQKAGELGIG